MNSAAVVGRLKEKSSCSLDVIRRRSFNEFFLRLPGTKEVLLLC